MKRENSADWKASVYIIFQFRLQTLFMNESMWSIDGKSSSALRSVRAFHRNILLPFGRRYDWKRYAYTGECRVGEAINNNCENSIIKNYGARWAQSIAVKIEFSSLCVRDCGFSAEIYFITKQTAGIKRCMKKSIGELCLFFIRKWVGLKAI